MNFGNLWIKYNFPEGKWVNPLYNSFLRCIIAIPFEYLF
jgi:hypothetical protein